jgi:hypothetical protein
VSGIVAYCATTGVTTVRRSLMPTQPAVSEIGVDDIPVIPAGVDKDQAKALLESARAGFARVHANFDAHELKAGRYVTVAALIVASANVLLVPAVLDALEPGRITILAGMLVAATSALVLFGIYAIVQIARVMRVETVPSPATNPAALLDAFVSQRVDLAQIGEAWRLMETADALETGEPRSRRSAEPRPRLDDDRDRVLHPLNRAFVPDADVLRRRLWLRKIRKANRRRPRIRATRHRPRT